MYDLWGRGGKNVLLGSAELWVMASMSLLAFILGRFGIPFTIEAFNRHCASTGYDDRGPGTIIHCY